MRQLDVAEGALQLVPHERHVVGSGATHHVAEQLGEAHELTARQAWHHPRADGVEREPSAVLDEVGWVHAGSCGVGAATALRSTLPLGSFGTSSQNSTMRGTL